MKQHRWLVNTVGVLICLLLVACAPFERSSQPNPTEFNSQLSASQSASEFSETADRIVALSPLTADIIGRLDATKLVGVPTSELLAGNPNLENTPQPITPIATGRTPVNLEQVVALEPDLVIGTRGFHDQPLQRLEELGIDTLSTEVESWLSLSRLTQRLAEVIGADPSPLLEHYQSFLGNTPDQDISALVLVSRQPILSPNKNSWAGDLLSQFKIQNLAADLQGQSPIRGYITLSPEKVLESNPAVIMVVEMGEDGLQSFTDDPQWNQLTAVQTGKVYEFDYYGLINPGSVQAIEKACNQLREILALS
jgi:iron complex transport system substrate-binding protein